jgi:hypothetical protein
MNSNFLPERSATFFCYSNCIVEWSSAFFCYSASICYAIEPEDRSTGCLCLICLLLYVTYIILSNPFIQRWRFGRTRRVTPTIQQDERAIAHCCICTEQIMIINGRASRDFGGLVRLVCNHYNHRSCVWLWMDERYRNAPRPNCPMCRQEMQFYWTDHGLPAQLCPTMVQKVRARAKWLQVPSLS